VQDGQQTYSLGFKCRLWQESIFKLIKRFSILVIHRRAGKTVLAILKLLDSALRSRRERPRYGYIAPELKQAKGVAWDYLTSYALKVPGTKVNQSELWVEFPTYMDPKSGAILGGGRVTLYGADNPNSLRGLRFDGVVIDEVADMPMALWGEVIVPALSDKGRLGWALFIGTPHGMNLFNDLYLRALVNPEWYHSLQTVYETGIYDEKDIATFKSEMTENQFKQEYLCDFEASNDNALITISMVNEAEKRVVPPDQYTFAPKILGVDVAWSGGDSCVVMKRQGLMSYEPLIVSGLPEKLFAAKVATVIQEWKPDGVFVDNTGGYGGETVSRLRDWGFNPMEVIFSWKGGERYANIRAEMWWRMMEWIRDGGRLPKHDRLRKELTTPTYTNHNAANRITLEPKELIKKRLGFSPDIADALALTFAFPVAVQSPADVVRSQRNDSWDFDPLVSPSDRHDPLEWK